MYWWFMVQTIFELWEWVLIEIFWWNKIKSLLSHFVFEELCPGNELTGLSSHASKCEFDGIEVPCFKSSNPGTLAHIKCKLGYETPESGFTSLLTCSNNGQWNHALPNCLPVCGLQTPQAKTFIVGGVETLPTTAPWNVAIFKNKDLICGGTILTEKIVLSAAHCFCECF